jgi:hypothetical protein
LGQGQPIPRQSMQVRGCGVKKSKEPIRLRVPGTSRKLSAAVVSMVTGPRGGGACVGAKFKMKLWQRKN